ncbi:hypothetical protein [Kocuria massiliensis]|uniref:hypothetical protein n=1 Tax=Kocuria massiliensis TaxID=1926282 RepID=UPI001179E459|nr:hypothetical protein [Kocuria massiliensis]
MRVAKHCLALSVCFAIAMYPWSHLTAHVVFVKIGVWLLGIAIAVCVMRIFGHTKYGFLAYIFVFGTLFVYISLNLRVEGVPTSISYAAGIFAYMDVYSLIFVSKKSKNTKISTRNEIYQPKRPNLIIVGFEISKQGDVSPEATPVEWSIDVESYMDKRFMTRASMNSSKHTLEFYLSELDADFFEKGKIVEDFRNPKDVTFITIYRQKYHSGTDLESYFGDSKSGSLSIYSPENVDSMGILFKKDSTDEFMTWVSELLQGTNK